MRELSSSELDSICGATVYSDKEVFVLSSTSAVLAGCLGYYMSYETFAFTEGLLFVSANTIPSTIATGLLLGSVALYHYALDTFSS